jgi:Ca2+-dependent lipid-binding protein
MNCKNIPILDMITKSSDPYVTIELLPKSLFQDFQIEKTNIVYKNLNPVFNENFCL